jgi:hypothetical protein
MIIKLNITEDEAIALKELSLNLLKTNFLTDRQSTTVSLLIIAIDKQLIIR